MTVIWIVITIAAIVALFAGWLAKYDKQRVTFYGKLASTFFESVQPIVEDDETPDEILDLVAFINSRIGDPKASRELRAVMLHAPRDEVLVHNQINGMKAFFERRPELMVPWLMAIYAALLATTYNDFWGGWRTRRTLSVMRRHHEVAPAVAKDLKDRLDHHNHADNGGALMPA